MYPNSACNRSAQQQGARAAIIQQSSHASHHTLGVGVGCRNLVHPEAVIRCVREDERLHGVTHASAGPLQLRSHSGCLRQQLIRELQGGPGEATAGKVPRRAGDTPVLLPWAAHQS